jgi:hypothetical protein
MAKARNNASRPAQSQASETEQTAQEEAAKLNAERMERNAAENQAEEDRQELEQLRKEKAEREAKKIEQEKPIPGAAMSIAVGAESDEKGDSAAEQVQEGVVGTRGKGWKYKLVVFHPKRNKSDPETVKLKLNGVGLLFHRETEVVVPLPYLTESADHATEDQFTQDPEKGFKRRASVKKYDYTPIRDATEDEYIQRLNDGNAKAKKYRMTMQAQS